jgi:hypothetical protein
LFLIRAMFCIESRKHVLPVYIYVSTAVSIATRQPIPYGRSVLIVAGLPFPHWYERKNLLKWGIFILRRRD